MEGRKAAGTFSNTALTQSFQLKQGFHLCKSKWRFIFHDNPNGSQKNCNHLSRLGRYGKITVFCNLNRKTINGATINDRALSSKIPSLFTVDYTLTHIMTLGSQRSNPRRRAQKDSNAAEKLVLRWQGSESSSFAPSFSLPLPLAQ